MGEVVFAPILHGSLPFARAVRAIFLRERPDCIAVELPETLTQPALRAVRRLPLLSLLRYREADGDFAYVLVEPCDGVVEAMRLGVEHDVPVHLVDRDTEGYALHKDPLPDAHAIDRIGYDAYVHEVAPRLGSTTPSAHDELREATMAFHLDRLRARHDKVLFVAGLSHTERVKARLESPTARPIGKTKRDGIEVLHLAESSSREVLSEPGRVQGLYERARVGEDAAPSGGRAAANDAMSGGADLDRYALMRSLLDEARERMRVEDGETLAPSSFTNAMRFARNQAIVRGGLAPDLFETTIAARGVHSDDFAWHVWDLGTAYPFQTMSPDVPAVHITLEELDRRARHLYFRRRLKTRRHALRLVRTRKKEERPGEWKENWKENWKESYLCSYPPEDLRIEEYGVFLKKRAKGMLATERARVVPFESSLLDGIDMRETIKNRIVDGRIYVKEARPIHGNVGAVIVVFADGDDARYGWTMTWQGEHEEESDMALYATPPDKKLVGPGIARCEYGGFLMTYPPGRMFHVFEDPFFDEAESKSERLVLAALDYASERWIVYVAKKAPRAALMQRAQRMGKQLMFIPMGALSPGTLRNLRVFHVLDGRKVRGYAKDYIG